MDQHPNAPRPNGYANSNGYAPRQGGYRKPAGFRKPDVPTWKDQQIWTQGLLQSLIRAGAVGNDKQQLWETTKMLRLLWQHSFGKDGGAG